MIDQPLEVKNPRHENPLFCLKPNDDDDGDNLDDCEEDKLLRIGFTKQQKDSPS